VDPAARLPQLLPSLLANALGLGVLSHAVCDSAALVLFVGLVAHLSKNVLVGGQ